MGDDRLFEATLASVLRNRPDESQIIVPHDDRFTDRHSLSDEVSFCPLGASGSKRQGGGSKRQGASLNSLFNRAFAESLGQVINLVRPGIEVDESWCDRAVEILTGNSKIASVAPPILNARQPKQLLACGINHSTRMKRRLIGGKSRSSWEQLNRQVIGPSSWCAFFLRQSLLQIVDENGEFGANEFHDSTFDLDIALALKTLGFKHQVSADCSVSSELDLSVIDEADLSGTDSSRLAVRYEGQRRSQSGLAKIVCAAGEFTGAMISPSRAKFVLGRIGAGKFHAVDQSFARRLAANLATADPKLERPPSQRHAA